MYQPTDNEGIIWDDDNQGNVKLTVKIPSYRPLNVAKSLGRMALFSYPPERDGYGVLRDWVVGNCNWFPVPLEIVKLPISGNTSVVQLNCHAYNAVPSRNIIRITFLYSTYLIAVPLALDKQELPVDLRLLEYPAPFRDVMLASTSRFMISSDFVEKEGVSEVLMTYGARTEPGANP